MSDTMDERLFDLFAEKEWNYSEDTCCFERWGMVVSRTLCMRLTAAGRSPEQIITAVTTSRDQADIDELIANLDRMGL